MINTNLGPYRILAKVGEGGMGEVYAARDTKLNRDVALKLLPAAVAQDRERLSRFHREALLLAALNHPHIAQIYGIEDSTARPALVMELVSGRTLADLMASGPVPLEDAIAIARQIAEALEAAHERGIVHRDLKPSNVCVTGDGTVKVLDFGLAKALDPSSGIIQPEGGDNSPTFTSPVMLPAGAAGSTAAGMILGTAGYMAPEQARGRPIDKRADIWAFGVVLAEMLIGRPLFAGESVAETIASVIKDDPKLDGLPPATPAAVRRLLARCLERDPKLRLRDIGEARILLSRPLDAEPVAAPPGRQRKTWIGAAAVAVLIAAVAAAAAWSLAPAPPIPVRRFELPASASAATECAIAPDGSRLAYIASGHLYVRAFDRLDPQDLGAVHATAAQPVWSPDGSTIAFTAEGTIRSIPAGGGPQFVIAKVPASGSVMGMGWLHDGRLVFSVWRDSLYTVRASGGRPEVRLAIDAAREIDFHDVAVLPGDRLLVSTHRRQEDSDVVELIDGDRRTVITDDPDVRRFTYVEPGVLVFQRRTRNPGVWAIPFQAGPIDVNRAVLVQAGTAAYDVSRDGTLVAFMPAPSRRGLVWVDRSGRAATPAPGALVEATTNDLELSPDGNRVAFVQGRLTTAGSGGMGSVNNASIVVRDLKSGVDTRLTLGTVAQGTWADAGGPTWNPAGDRVIHREGGIEQQRLVERRADAASEGRTLAPGSNGRLLPDEKTLVYTVDERGAERLRSATIGADGPVDAQPLFPGGNDPDVLDFDLSSDGRLIAFVIAQPNRRGVLYVAALNDLAVRRLVHEGAVRPRFAREGQELFFLSGTQDERGQPLGRLMSVTVTSGSSLVLGAPVEILRESPGGPDLTSYDVAPAGDRLLMWMTAPVSPEDRPRLIFVQNALAGLR